MKEHPLPLMPDMVRAYYEDRKSQTRRVIAPQRTDESGWLYHDRGNKVYAVRGDMTGAGMRTFLNACPYGQVGDRLWIREALVRLGNYVTYTHDGAVIQRDGKPILWPWKVGKLASRYMPYWACRSWAELVAVRVEQVQNISEADAIAEGTCVDPERCAPYYQERGVHRRRFEKLWDSINEPRGYGWASNPWVWVLTFKRIAE